MRNCCFKMVFYYSSQIELQSSQLTSQTNYKLNITRRKLSQLSVAMSMRVYI